MSNGNHTMSKLYHGSCLCGSVKYEITSDPFSFIICHCANCRKSSGSAFQSNVFFPPDKVSITHGKDIVKLYVDNNTKTGTPLYRWHCSYCGSSLFITNEDNKFRIVNFGTLDDEVDWQPRKEGFDECKRDWVVGIKTVPKSKMRAKL